VGGEQECEECEECKGAEERAGRREWEAVHDDSDFWDLGFGI
jgi:hypothetical protein